jgi:uncharacterized membrane protein YhaH (DUF805 family)
MDFATSIKTCLGKFATFQGRASRSEYWYFILFTVLVNIVLSVVSGVLGDLGAILALLVMIALAIPGLAAAVRRMHDIDRSGWWYLLVLVPLVGAIVVLIWFCKKGTEGANRFGEPVLPALEAVSSAA